MTTTQPASGAASEPAGALTEQQIQALMQATGMTREQVLALQGGGQQTSGATPQPIGMDYYAVDPATQQYTGERATATRPRARTPFDLPGAWNGQPQTEQVLPRYYEGQERLYLAGMPPEVLGALQQQMIKLHLYSDDKPNIIRNFPDPDTVNAFKIVLGAANTYGMTYSEVLQKMTTDQIAAGQPVPTTPHAIRITSPTELAASFRTAGLQTLGRAPDDDEVARMVTAYQALERQAQTQFYSAEESGTGNVDVMSAPPQDAFAAEQLRQAHPGEYEQNRLLETVNSFRKLLAGRTGMTRTPGTG